MCCIIAIVLFLSLHIILLVNQYTVTVTDYTVATTLSKIIILRVVTIYWKWCMHSSCIQNIPGLLTISTCTFPLFALLDYCTPTICNYMQRSTVHGSTVTDELNPLLVSTPIIYGVIYIYMHKWVQLLKLQRVGCLQNRKTQYSTKTCFHLVCFTITVTFSISI